MILHLDKNQYEECLSQNDLEIYRKWPEEDFINKGLISESYITAECCYDKNKIAEKIMDEFDEFNILFENNFHIAKVALNDKK